MDDGIKKSLFDVAVTAAISALLRLIPFLNLPVINTIVTWVLTSLAQKLYANIQQFVDFKAIEAKIKTQVTNYDQAVTELKAIHDKQGATDAEIAAAKKKFQDTLGPLVRFNA